MKQIAVGDEIEIYKVGARDPWRSEVVALHFVKGALHMIRARVPGGGMLWLDARDGKARDGWSLAPKHVPAWAEKEARGTDVRA